MFTNDINEAERIFLICFQRWEYAPLSPKSARRLADQYDGHDPYRAGLFEEYAKVLEGKVSIKSFAVNHAYYRAWKAVEVGPVHPMCYTHSIAYVETLVTREWLRKTGLFNDFELTHLSVTHSDHLHEG